MTKRSFGLKRAAGRAVSCFFCCFGWGANQESGSLTASATHTISRMKITIPVPSLLSMATMPPTSSPEITPPLLNSCPSSKRMFTSLERLPKSIPSGPEKNITSTIAENSTGISRTLATRIPALPDPLKRIIATHKKQMAHA